MDQLYVFKNYRKFVSYWKKNHYHWTSGSKVVAKTKLKLSVFCNLDSSTNRGVHVACYYRLRGVFVARLGANGRGLAKLAG